MVTRLTALCLVLVPAVAIASPMQGQQISFAEVHFRLAVPTAQNDQLRHRLIKIAVTEQLRGGPIGVGGAVFGDADYTVQIKGSCKGAVRQLGQIVRRISAGLPDRGAITQSYDGSARCLAKRTRVHRS